VAGSLLETPASVTATAGLGLALERGWRPCYGGRPQEARMSPTEYQALVEFLGRQFAEVDQRFAQVDQRFAAIDQRFAAIDQRFDALTTELREFRQDILAHFDEL
jgi:hypothetical protein